MKISNLPNTLTSFLLEKINVFLWSMPGIGKTSAVRHAVRIIRQTIKPNYGLIVMDASLMDAVDINGTPSVQDGSTIWFPPSFWDEANQRRVALHLEPDWEGVIFMDEFAQGTKLVINALGTVVEDRRLGQYKLPEGVSIVAASNRREHKSGTQELPTQVKTRFLHLDVDCYYDDFQAVAAMLDFDPRIGSFLGLRQELIAQFDAKAQSFPTLRTWHRVSRVLRMDIPIPVRNEAIMGLVGKGPGTEFVGFCDKFEALPSFSSILKDPATADVPDHRSDPSAVWALSALLALNATEANIDTLSIYIDRLPTEFQMVVFAQLDAFANAVIDHAATQAVIDRKASAKEVLESAWGVRMAVEHGNKSSDDD